jgi:hypothetical protein
MRKLAIIIGAAVIAAACAFGGEQITFTVATGTNTSVTAYANPFTGEIDEIALYATVATGAVSIAALNPYSGAELVLCTNSTVGTALVWTPRGAAAATTGSVARTVGATLSDDRFNMQGESLRLAVDNARTGVTYRVHIKTK